MTDLEQKLKAAFKEELATCVAQLEACLTQAQECEPEKLPEIFAGIFQIAHMLKGASRAVGLTVVESITGRMETLFYRLQSGAVMEIDGLDEVVRGCIAYLAHSADEQPPPPEKGKELIQGLDKFLNQETPTSEAVPDALRREIAQTFFVESEEILSALRRLFTENQALTAESPILPQDDVEDAFRKAHTLKGGARLIEYHGLENQAHALEEILSQLKTGAVPLEGDVLSRITSLLDGLENGIIEQQEKLAAIESAPVPPSAAPQAEQEVSAEVRFEEDAPPAPSAEALAQSLVEEFEQEARESQVPAESPETTAALDSSPEALLAKTASELVAEMEPRETAEAEPEAAPEESPAAPSRPKLRAVPNPHTPSDYAPDSPAQQILSEFKSPAPPPQRTADQMRAAIPPNRTEAVKVQLENLDPLYKAVVSLHLEVQAQAQVQDMLRSLATLISEIRHDWDNTRRNAAATLRRLSMDERTARVSHYFDLIGKQTRDLRMKLDATMQKQRKAQWDLHILSQKLKRDVRRIYTVPASSVFFGFRKMVTDIANEFKKEVTLVTLGLETEADRTVLQGLKEPVLHIVRNCLFHGIERPDVREQIGKKRQGTITLKITRETNSLCAEVSDDGTGIAFEKIRQKAIALGKFSAADAPKKTEAELISLIFAPGFSTADDVNNVAGRGVGLSAVRKSLEEIGGKLEVTSKAGRGCRFLLRIPLHVSTQPLILFQVEKRTYAVPVAGVQRLLRIPHDSIKDVGNRRVATTAEGQVLFKPMREVLGGKSEAAAAPQHWSGLVVQNDQQKVFVAVDGFLGHREAVIKKLGRISESWDLICGGVLLENGKVALVVDPRQLAKQVIGGNVVAPKTRVTDSKAEDEIGAPKRILVVDDSITTRTLEKSILETYGYHVELAVDGEDAMRRLKHEDYELVVTDLEMPRLNGFELVQAMKADEKLKKIPVIMVTSVENPKDRERGMTTGADAYVVKQKFDQQELLQTIRHFI